MIQIIKQILIFTFMHLADAFIQSDLQYIQAIHLFISMCVEPTTFCAANAMLYHWATGILHKDNPSKYKMQFWNNDFIY